MKLFGNLRRLHSVRTFLAAALAISFNASSSVAEDTYTIGIVPQFEAKKLAAIWAPVIQEIEQRADIELNMVGSPRIPDFEKSFMQGEFDFAYMNPYHSLIALKQQGYQPLIRDGAKELYGVLVVRKDSSFQKPTDLAGRTIAFPAPNALGASLLMRADLDTKFNVTFRSQFVNTHASAYFNAVLGETDAAGGVMGTYMALEPVVRDHLRIIYETTRLPPHPIVAHPRVPTEVAERVQQAILDLAETEEGQSLLSAIPIHKAIIPGVSDYLMLESLNLDRYYYAN